MKKYYVIKLLTGSYESGESLNIALTTDFEKAQAYVEKQRSVFAGVSVKLDNFFGVVQNAWLLENPRPVRKVFNKSQDKQSNDEYLKEVRAWVVKNKEFVDGWQLKNLTEDEFKLKGLYFSEPFWEVEEIQQLDELV